MIEVILIMAAVIGVLIVVIILLNKAKNHKIKNLESSNRTLSNKIKVQNRSIQSMKDHSKRIKYTKEELEPIKEMVKEATDEEDIMDAISLISNINDRKL